ncbi:maleylpyruvate isomerase family mycothiol-dependent enzyme [Nocardia vinacea]|uniref:maleylpyruvate isomerase family mycothiol-dependent enzyme n=1 Tax=Nocardia vinacea TaxID=96468 RepID=UPI002E1588BC|nr:maleylpyruvate isomerase family mycothiol-dependent enzyme [Nocardia vinacea]
MEFHELDLPERLLLARRGTAYFAQRIAELSDTDFDSGTLLAAWTRRHLIAHVGYNAAALCRLLDWAATGIETPMYASAGQRAGEIDEGATLSPAALRNLFHHTAARLDEKWRHLPESAWTAEVRTAQGRVVPAAETVWMRVREVWIHAVDLADDGRFGDFPTVVLDSLLTDIVGMWRRKGLGTGLVLTVDDRAPIAVQENSPTTTRVSGPLAAVARWAAGRGAIGLETHGDTVQPPAWL